MKRSEGLVPLVIRGLIDRIDLGEFKPGAVLPKEAQLGVEYGVSRPVIREALRALSEKGLITVRQGRGTVVNDRAEWDLLDPEVLRAVVARDRSQRVVSQLVRVRAAVEAELARTATEQMTSEQHTRLRELVDELSASTADRARYAAVDRAFHDHIMVVASNPFGRVIVRKLSALSRAAPRPNGFDPREVDLSHKGHSEVFVAMGRGDARGAAEAMRAHILGTWAFRLEINNF